MPNFYSDWLETPESGGTTAAYMGTLANMMGMTPAMKNYWQNMYGNVYGQYLGALGQQAMSGQDPNLKWLDSLNNYGWAKNYYNAPKSQTGLYAPRSRYNWLVY